MKRSLFIVVIFIFYTLFIIPVNIFATNPIRSNRIVNLSEGETQDGLEDKSPEMIIEGNTIHTIWIHFEYGKKSTLIYRRSTDLGKTWETPINIYNFMDNVNYSEPTNKRLAVDNGVVHICIPDYDYNDNGTARLFYFRSTNNGASFEQKKELANDGGGYKGFGRSFIKASNGKVAIAIDGGKSLDGTQLFLSTNGGNDFTHKLVFDEANNVSDLFFDGNQIIILTDYTYYFYGLNKGYVWVSVSNDLGKTFKTTRLSKANAEGNERFYSSQYQHYVPKIAKSGNNIHVIFSASELGTVVYSRSTDNGETFNDFVDINKGVVSSSYILNGNETITAKGNYVYLVYLKKGGYPYLSTSNNNGSSLTDSRYILPDEVDYINRAYKPFIICDSQDPSGKSVFLGGGNTLLTKSVDGGSTFSNSSLILPFAGTRIDVDNQQVYFDDNGGKHWIFRSKLDRNSDFDIFYGNILPEPNPGNKNMALDIKMFYDYSNSPQIDESIIVPSSDALQFTDKITAEAWVKILPGSKYKINVLAKVNGNDSDIHNPSGFSISFYDYSEKIRYLYTGINTDKGEFENKAKSGIEDNLWHHVAFTYDEGAVPNNFKSYLDGILVAEQTVTGKVTQADGLLILGTRGSFYQTANYQIDDIRIWDKALTQEEILSNQNKTLTGNEEGLRLFLNFDNTFKDISGHGNDAIPLNLGNLKESDFNPPITKFTTNKDLNEVVFTNKTEKGKNFIWNFGDEKTSEEGSPIHCYDVAGEYHISLTSKNETSVTSAIKHVTIEGLNKVEPSKSGNIGYATIVVSGGGLTSENTTITLRKNGFDDIVGTRVMKAGEDRISAIFDLNNAPVGIRDVVINTNGNEQVLTDTFSIVEGEAPDPWVQVVGQGNVLFNTWTKYTIEYGNNGNTDALGVPLWIVFEDVDGFELEFIDVDIEEPKCNSEKGILNIKDSIPLFFVSKNYFGNGRNGIVYPLYIPSIPSNSTDNFHIRIKTNADIEIESWVSDPFYSGLIDATEGKRLEDVPFSEMNSNARQCIGVSMANAVKDGLLSLGGAVLPIGCINSVISTVFNPADYAKPKTEVQTKATIGSTLWSIASMTIGCAGDLPYFKAYKISLAIVSLGASMYDGYLADKACRDSWLKKSKNKHEIGAVSSFDPNEIYGPDGYGDDNYIKLNSVIPYYISFENKSSATAPAHLVKVTDTLDLSVFNLESFGFGSFGFGDTLISLSGYPSKEFSMDIDLRPKISTIARISGKLNVSSGIITWEFLSLNPETMLPETDPFVGFLPPNNNNPEGEGFVSYRVGLKQSLATGTTIKNKAVIIFDANKPIVTNEYINKLDIDPPVSSVKKLENEISDTTFKVEWSGTDNGSGINEYSIWVLINDTDLRPWKVDTTGTSALFKGEKGYNYKFYSIARDNVSWIEDTPLTYDAETIILGIENYVNANSNLLAFPNPVKGKLSIRLENTDDNRYRVELLDVIGKSIYSRTVKGDDIKKGISIDVNMCNAGSYILRVSSENQSFFKKIIFK